MNLLECGVTGGEQVLERMRLKISYSHLNTLIIEAGKGANSKSKTVSKTQMLKAAAERLLTRMSCIGTRQPLGVLTTRSAIALTPYSGQRMS